jgi:hypothetical protein
MANWRRRPDRRLRDDVEKVMPQAIAPIIGATAAASWPALASAEPGTRPPPEFPAQDG